MNDLLAQAVANTLPEVVDPDTQLIRDDGKAVLCVLDDTGDTKTIWDPANPDEVENAKATFDRLKAKGYVAYKVTADGKDAGVMNEFDPNARAMVMRPVVKGG